MKATFAADEILYATNGVLKSGRIEPDKGSIVWEIDDIRNGDWFIAIPDQFHDPHDHLDHAISRGARGVIVNRRQRYTSASPKSNVIMVPDTKTALIDIVRYWRYCVNPRVVGIAGSIGRRVTMLLLSQFLETSCKTHLAFMGNLGWFGCAKEILSMPRDTEVLIFEAGAVERGDITRIGGALDPELAVITQIRHPLPSAERDSFVAALYCELLETLSEVPEERLAAVIYDDNPAVQRRADEVVGKLLAQKWSASGRSISDRVADSSITELSAAMESAVGQKVSRAELWCAAEAAKALGVSKASLEDILELTGEMDTEISPYSQKNIA